MEKEKFVIWPAKYDIILVLKNVSMSVLVFSTYVTLSLFLVYIYPHFTEENRGTLL